MGMVAYFHQNNQLLLRGRQALLRVLDLALAGGIELDNDALVLK